MIMRPLLISIACIFNDRAKLFLDDMPSYNSTFLNIDDPGKVGLAVFYPVRAHIDHKSARKLGNYPEDKEEHYSSPPFFFPIKSVILSITSGTIFIALLEGAASIVS